MCFMFIDIEGESVLDSIVSIIVQKRLNTLLTVLLEYSSRYSPLWLCYIIHGRAVSIQHRNRFFGPRINPATAIRISYYISKLQLLIAHVALDTIL